MQRESENTFSHPAMNMPLTKKGKKGSVKEPENPYKEWLEQIYVSEKVLEKKAKIWDRMIDYYKGKFHGNPDDADRIVVNYIYAYVQTIIPQVYYKNPYIIVTPKKIRPATSTKTTDLEQPDLKSILGDIAPNPYSYISSSGSNEPMKATDRAKILEDIINYYFDELFLKKEYKKCIKDALLCAHGYMKYGYTFEKDLKEKNKEDGTLDYEETIRKGELHAFRISPKQVLFPVGYDDLAKMPWVIIKYVKPTSDVKNNKALQNTDQVKGEKISDVDIYKLDLKNRSAEIMSVESYTTIYEIWDKRNNKVMTITKDGVELDKKDEWPIDINGFPVKELVFNGTPDEYYAVPHVKYIEPQVKELNKLRSRQMKHNAKNQRKYTFDKNKVDEVDLKDLKNGEDLVLVPCDGDPTNAVAAVQDAPLSGDQHIMQADCKNDIQVILGINDNNFGSGQQAAQSATEAGIVEANKKLRTDEYGDVVQDFVMEGVRVMAQIIGQTYENDLVQRITGSGLTWEKVIDSKLIEGEFDFKMEAGAALPMTDDRRREQLINVIKLFSAPMFATLIDWPVVLRKVFKTFRLTDLEDVVKGDESQAEALSHADKENQLMFMGREVHANAFEAHIVHLKKHAMFAQTNPAGTFSEMTSAILGMHIQEHVSFMTQGGVDMMRGGSPLGGSAPNPATPAQGAPQVNEPMNSPGNDALMSAAMGAESGQ